MLARPKEVLKADIPSPEYGFLAESHLEAKPERSPLITHTLTVWCMRKRTLATATAVATVVKATCSAIPCMSTIFGVGIRLIVDGICIVFWGGVV